MIAVAVLTAGCAPLSELKKKISSSDLVSYLVPRNAAQEALDEGIELYDEGNFRGAIKHLSNASAIWSADKEVQVEALKYMAFSYCVTSRRTLCKRRFEKALKLDPAFDLEPGEKGHPLWWPVFTRAKRQSDLRRREAAKSGRPLRAANTASHIRRSSL